MDVLPHGCIGAWGRMSSCYCARFYHTQVIGASVRGLMLVGMGSLRTNWEEPTITSSPCGGSAALALYVFSMAGVYYPFKISATKKVSFNVF